MACMNRVRFGVLGARRGIDAVVVASPMPLHVANSVAALAAGKHVLSEVSRERGGVPVDVPDFNK
jgi:hypothetical protein